MLDPLTFEIIKNALTSIAEEMGIVLRRASFSPNIKERRDSSCALFETKGRLAAQAEHIPVHLGAMPHSVRTVLEEFGDDLSDGDVVMLNDPFRGGTHLPDITVNPNFPRRPENRLCGQPRPSFRRRRRRARKHVITLYRCLPGGFSDSASQNCG